MSLKIKQLPLSERPYEKMELYGPEILSNSELLAIIIKTGTKDETSVTVAQKILSKLDSKDENNLRFLEKIPIEELIKIKGIGKVKALQIKAVIELAKRMARPIDNKIIIKNPRDIAKILIEELRYEKKEKVKLIILNSKNIVQKIIDISIGSTSFAMISIKEVLVESLKESAEKIIIVHNHPSGDPTPSKQDYKITDQIYDAANLVGIELIDHIIIGDGIYQSIFQKED